MGEYFSRKVLPLKVLLLKKLHSMINQGFENLDIISKFKSNENFETLFNNTTKYTFYYFKGFLNLVLKKFEYDYLKFELFTHELKIEHHLTFIF